MRKRDELTDPKSCMSRARDDEWTFVLLGRDLAATAAVRAWIEERIRLGKNQRNDPQIVKAKQWIESVETEQAGCQCLGCIRGRGDTQFGVPVEKAIMLICNICGNKRCPHSDWHGNGCTRSNAPGQPGSRLITESDHA